MSETFAIETDLDIVAPRQRARELASKLGLSHAAIEGVAIALTEVARNILVHGGGAGTVTLCIDRAADGRDALVIVASDHGPGIADVALALQDGFSTAGTLGLGLAGARRLVDELHITTAPGAGTTVTLRKWGRKEST